MFREVKREQTISLPELETRMWIERYRERTGFSNDGLKSKTGVNSDLKERLTLVFNGTLCPRPRRPFKISLTSSKPQDDPFDAPGAGTGSNQGTLPLAITPAGVIMGLYRDAKNLSHGFLFRP